MSNTGPSRRKALALASVVTAVIVVFAAVLPYLTAGADVGRKDFGQTAWWVIMPSNSNVNVTVLGDSDRTPFIAEVVGTRASGVDRLTDPMNLNGSVELLIVDCSNLTWQSLDPYIAPIRGAVLNGTPVMMVNDTAGILDRVTEGQSIAYMSAASTESSPIAVRALKHDPLGGTSGSLDLGGRAGNDAQLSEALIHAYDWSTDRIANSSPGNLTDEIRLIYGAFTYSYYSGDVFEPFGRIAVLNQYAREVWNDSASTSLEGWYVHYRLESSPGYGAFDNDYMTRKIAVASTTAPEDSLTTYHPSTGYGIDHVSVYLSPNRDPYTQWNYYVRGVKMLDHSNFGENTFALEHQVGVGEPVGKEPYTVEPGVSMMIAKGSSFSLQDTYIMEWQKPSLFIWEGSTVTLRVSGTIMG